MVRKNVIGWLDLKGDFYSCYSYGHDELADALIEAQKIEPIIENGYVYFGTGLLEKLGYIRLTQSRFYETIHETPDKGFAYCNFDVKITKEQLKWFEDNKEILSNAQRLAFEDYIDFHIED